MTEISPIWFFIAFILGVIASQICLLFWQDKIFDFIDRLVLKVTGKKASRL